MRPARLFWLPLATGALVCLIFAGAVAWPWLHPRFGYFVDDGYNTAARLFLFDQLLRRGQFFPRWWPELFMGYGYPLFNYYAPGPYWLGELFVLAGASVYRAIQLLGGAAVAIGALGAFALGAALFRHPAAAVIASGAYVLSPYPFVTNLYQRSAIGEALGQGLLPWLLLSTLLAMRRGGRAAVVVLPLAVAAVVIVHTLTAFIALGLAACWIAAGALELPRAARAARVVAASAGVALGLGLSAWAWVPAVFERGAVHTEFGTHGNLSPLRWLFDPFRPTAHEIELTVPQSYDVTPWLPFDGHLIYPHAEHGLPGPAKPGLGQVAFLAGAGLALLIQQPEWFRLSFLRGLSGAVAPARWHSRPSAFVLVAAALILLLWFLNLRWSAPFWRSLPLLPLLQFPWRLLGAWSLAVALVGASTFAWLARQGHQQWALALVLVTFLGVNALAGRPTDVRMIRPGGPTPEPNQLWARDSDPLTGGTTSGGEFLPRWVQFDPSLPANSNPPGQHIRDAYESLFPNGGWTGGRAWPYAGNVRVEQLADAPGRTEALIEVGEGAPAELAFRTLVFPGWRAYVDGQPTPLRAAPYDQSARLAHGFTIVSVPPGRHAVTLALGPTMPHTLGAMLAIAAAGAIAAFLLSRGGSRWPLRGPLPAATLGLALLFVVLRLGADLWALWRPPLQVRTPPSVIAVDVLGRAQRGEGVRIVAPEGSAPGAFVNMRPLTVGGQSRTWLYMHPPSSVSVDLDVPPRAVFQSGLALDPQAWDVPGADGVRFILEVEEATGPRRTLLDEVVQPQTRQTDRGWRFATVDLGPYAGRRVTLTLRTDGRDTPSFDWAGWAEPTVYVDYSARYPPPQGTSPAARPR